METTYRAVYFHNENRIFFVDASGESLDCAIRLTTERLRRLMLEWDKINVYSSKGQTILIIPAGVKFNHINELF